MDDILDGILDAILDRISKAGFVCYTPVRARSYSTAESSRVRSFQDDRGHQHWLPQTSCFGVPLPEFRSLRPRDSHSGVTVCTFEAKVRFRTPCDEYDTNTTSTATVDATPPSALSDSFQQKCLLEIFGIDGNLGCGIFLVNSVHKN